MNNVSSEMAALNSVKDQRLQSLRRSDPDAFKAVMWLRENRHLFSGRVFDPPLLELDVKDRYKGFVNAIENPIRWTTLKVSRQKRICTSMDYMLIALLPPDFCL
jgi:hypothetical protein